MSVNAWNSTVISDGSRRGGSFFPPNLHLTKAKKKRQESTLQLSSLPGISKFAERAVVGMLKAFARIYRDRAVQQWNRDPRLACSKGGEFELEISIGMSAGWAIEGAVGSTQKVDATYLSPHVNNAARLMAACGQYGVPFLLNGSVQELFSKASRRKLRFLDNVFTKGSKEQQRLYTYDAKHKGVPFFMMSKSDKVSDREAENFNEFTWDNDTDLVAIRRHISEDFKEEFKRGRDLYLKGKWPEAIASLKAANEIMRKAHRLAGWEREAQSSSDEEEDGIGIVDDDESRDADGGFDYWNDGPSLALIDYMERNGGKAKKGFWKGCRQLPKRAEEPKEG